QHGLSEHVPGLLHRLWWTAPESNRAPHAALWPSRASTTCAARKETRRPEQHSAGAAGKVVAHGAGTHLDDGSVHWIFRGLRSSPAPRTPAGRLDKAGHRTGARAVPPKQYGGQTSDCDLGQTTATCNLSIP